MYFTKQLIIIASEKGGVGKTTLSLAVYDRLTLEGANPTVIQVDRQRRLSAAIDSDVLTIASDPQAQRQDPALEIRRFSPIMTRIESAAKQAPILIDVGAGEAGRFAAWAGLVDLQEDLDEWDLKCCVLIPFLAEAESIRQAAWTADRLHAALPKASIAFIENCRDGEVALLHPGSDAAVAFTENLLPWLSRCAFSLTMPGIPAGSWRHFEAASCRFVDVVAMPTSEVMSRTGLARAEAKIARGDISQWLLQIFDELNQLLGTRSGD